MLPAPQNAEVGVRREAEAEIIMAPEFTVKINLSTLVGYLYLQKVLYHLIGQTVFCTALSKTAAGSVRLYL